MAEGEALKRLGGGRWKTADDRFTIEPQSGSWVVVDGEQTDDLGLALVRGPFTSLTAARSAIDAARLGEAPVSPLAARVAEERRNPRPVRDARPTSPTKARQADKPKPQPQPKPKPPEPPPPELAWIVKLPASRRRAARTLIDRLTEVGVPDAEGVARAEVADGQPAVARAALVRQLRQAIERQAANTPMLVAELVALLAAGRDEELGVEWRLVDGEDRSLAPLSSIDPDNP